MPLMPDGTTWVPGPNDYHMEGNQLRSGLGPDEPDAKARRRIGGAAAARLEALKKQVEDEAAALDDRTRSIDEREAALAKREARLLAREEAASRKGQRRGPSVDLNGPRAEAEPSDSSESDGSDDSSDEG